MKTWYDNKGWELFYSRFKKLRADSGLSAEQLGKAIGVSNNAIIKWEHGKAIPGIDNLYKIAKYFNVTADYLIGLKDY